MPPRPPRRILLPPAVAALALAAVTACADSSTAPIVADATKAPAFNLVQGSVDGVDNLFEDFNLFGVSEAVPSANGCGVGSPGRAGVGTLPWECVAPAAWKPTDTEIDIAMHLRDRAVWNAPEPFRGMHGDYCQPYQFAENHATMPNGVRAGALGSHPASTYDDMNYRCRDHMMTSLKPSGYGAIYVTPNATVNLSGTVTIRFATATLRLAGAPGSEDWIDLWITPWSQNLQLPLDTELSDPASASTTDLQGPPAEAVHIRMAGAPGATTFKLSTVSNHQESAPVVSSQTLEQVVTKTTSTFRDTFQLEISKSHVRFGILKRTSATQQHETVWFIDAPIALPSSFDASVVQFGHHSRKQALSDNDGVGGTWHWDDFRFSPRSSVQTFRVARARNPSTGVPGNDRFADSQHPEVVFPVPTVAAGYLRFAGYGEKVEVSLDGERTWQKAERPLEKYDVPSRFHSYWMPVPAGVSRVSFRAKKDPNANEASNRDQGPWRVRDVSVWMR